MKQYYITGNINKDIENLEKILKSTNQQVIVSNLPEAMYFLGVMVIDQCFGKLKKLYQNKIDIEINTGDSLPAFFTAKKLGYTNIQHSIKTSSVT
ncbi:hypothetical protein [Candidatus Sneabacter namystus]|uniref:Uncharacterized protein n=1 Tax=Candidatus Sneabacter namystus TaxID=2601646 RepID=A0A5C0UJ31_9RICK|nr:hypothetical protein [Candidatus Sneabacter namystus]QEK39621.1 hypothetical protein FZC37_01575 [Candidatus Sneabacter namystus]